MAHLKVRHTVFSVALLKRISSPSGLPGDELARASAALWLEMSRQCAYLDEMARPEATVTPIGSDEPLTAKHAKLHKVA